MSNEIDCSKPFVVEYEATMSSRLQHVVRYTPEELRSLEYDEFEGTDEEFIVWLRKNSDEVVERLSDTWHNNFEGGGFTEIPNSCDWHGQEAHFIQKPELQYEI